MGLKFRRGTTAQKSGSLAFGEPYVNTDLGTLQIGGATGDITLGASGTGSAGQFSSISGSGLDITGNANIGGDLTIGGKIQIGDNSSDTVNVVASLSSSLIPSITNTFDLGSETKIWRDLYISTGSIKIVNPGTGTVVGTLSSNAGGDFKVAGEISGSTINGIGNVSLYSSSVANRLAAAEAFSSSLDTTFATDASVTIVSASAWGAFQSASSYSGSLATTISASKAEYTSFSASAAVIDNGQTTNITANSASAWGAFQSASAYSASAATVAITNANSAAGAFASASSYSGSFYTTINTNIGNINSNSQSAAGAFASASAYSSSAATTYAVLNRANTFTGTQTITGSLYVSSNLIVQGSSSLQNITASAASIGTNTVILNTATPSVRFGGISVQDSGSGAGTSGSLLWDSQNDVWIYQQPSGAVEGYQSARLISGPKNSGSLGGELGLTVGQVPVAVGDDHIGDSIISASATKVTIAGGLDVTGALSASTITGFGNVTSHSSSVNTRILANVDSAAGAFASASAYSSSAATVAITNANSAAGAFASASSYSGSFYTTINTAIGNITTAQNSANGAYASASAYSSSFAAATTTINGTGVKIGTTNTITAAANTLTDFKLPTTVTGSSLTSVGTITTGVWNGTAIANGNLANSSVTVTAGTGMSGGGAVALGSSVTLTNAGVTSNVAGTGVSVSGATGAVTISIGQAVATTDNVRFNSVGVGMAASATAGRIDAAGDVVAYSSSDKNFKENITPIENPIEKIRKISGNTYDWKADLKDVHGYEGNDVGVIAQEIEEVLPQIVTTRENGYKAVKYEKLVALLIEGIKAQQNQIDSLTIEIENLKKNNSL